MFEVKKKKIENLFTKNLKFFLENNNGDLNRPLSLDVRNSKFEKLQILKI